jgi:O-antigen ligase
VGILEMALLGAGAAAGLALIELVIRRSDYGAALVLGLFVVQEMNLTTLAFDAGGIRVQSTDILFVILLSAATARLLRAAKLTTAQRLLVALSIIASWALVRGAGPFGIPAAVNEARRFLWFVGPALYFATVEPRRALLDRIGRMWLLAAAALGALTLIRWLAQGVGLYGGFFGTETSLRVIPAAATLILAQGALLAFPLMVDRTAGWRRYIAPSLLVLVLVLQHRTVWVVAAVGVLLLFSLERELSRRALTALGSVVVLFGLLVFTVFDDPSVDISEQLASSAQSTATFEWRVEGWTSLLTESGPEDTEELLVGKPFGSGWSRSLPNGRVIPSHIQPHNFYVEAALRVGAIGLLVLALLFIMALRGISDSTVREEHGDGLLTPTALLVMVAGQLVLFLTYAPDSAQGMLLGLAVAVAAGGGQRRRASKVRTGVVV